MDVPNSPTSSTPFRKQIRESFLRRGILHDVFSRARASVPFGETRRRGAGKNKKKNLSDTTIVAVKSNFPMSSSPTRLETTGHNRGNLSYCNSFTANSLVELGLAIVSSCRSTNGTPSARIRETRSDLGTGSGYGVRIKGSSYSYYILDKQGER